VPATSDGAPAVLPEVGQVSPEESQRARVPERVQVPAVDVCVHAVIGSIRSVSAPDASRSSWSAVSHTVSVV